MASGQPRYSMVRFDSGPDDDDLHTAMSRDVSFDISRPSSSHRRDSSNALGITVSPSGPLQGDHAEAPEYVSDTISRNSTTSLARSSTARLNPSPNPHTSVLSGSTQFDSEFEDFDHSYDASKARSAPSPSSSNRGNRLAKTQTGFSSIRPRYDSFMPHQSCQATRNVKTRRCNHIALTIILLAVFSTVFSGVFLFIALIGPHYGRSIRLDGGSLTPDAAATLTTVFARLIEMSFVPVVVAFIGQVLARRAYYRDAPRGVTMAEISMRGWIAQPGTMLTNWHSVRYAAFSVLGVVALVTALLVTLYSVAATALVQPQLRFLDWSSAVYRGRVNTQFANSAYAVQVCESPLNTGDPVMGQNCVNMEHASMAYHNYYSYMTSWAELGRNGTGADGWSSRPKGSALVNDNHTISAPWIEQMNIQSLGGGKFVNNVTMAMPHTGVIQAGADPINKILQPNEADSATYILQASVPSPMINVLCVTMSADDLAPFVFDWQKMGLKEYDQNVWQQKLNLRNPYLNGTQFDDVFRWGPKYGAANYPPIFPMLPAVYNTIVNDTIGVKYGRKTIYVLGQGNFSTQANYSLCQLQAGLTPVCSTQYSATSAGGSLEALCEDPHDKMQYLRSNRIAPVGNDTINPDWPVVASDWARSLSLNDGVFDGNSSNARQLTSFIVTEPTLSPTLPSMAEALAVMAGCTLIESVTDSPFVPFWNYTNSTIEGGTYQSFNATIRPQQYASGGFLAYQKPFYVILFGVFVMNIWVLGYLLWHRDWYTDFSEPMNLFSLAVNSPPSERLAGCCGAGPSGEHYKVSWKLSNDAGHVYMESQEPRRSATQFSPMNWRNSMNSIMTPLNGLKGKVWR